MRRIVQVLGAVALMVVLMATTVSPAFAGPYNHTGKGWGVDEYNGGCEYGPSTSSTQNAEGWYWGKCTKIDYKK